MSTWNTIRDEFRDSQHKSIRLKYVKKLVEYTDRNLLIYHADFTSGTKPAQRTTLGNSDKRMIFDAIEKLESSKGLDVMIESPGGRGEVA